MSLQRPQTGKHSRRPRVRRLLGWVLVALLLLIPMTTALVCVDGWLVGRPRKIFGQNLVGAKRLYVHARADRVVANYSYGWRGAAPQRWNRYPFPGVIVSKNVVVINDPRSNRGDVIIAMWFRWPLVLALNRVLLVAAIIAMVCLLRRRYGPGHCRVCGYDLRASSDRCPECGTPLTEQA